MRSASCRFASPLLAAALSAGLLSCHGDGGGRSPAAGPAARTSAGTISGLGSILLNGDEWQIPGDPGAITIDGEIRPESDLRIGMTVEVTGSLGPDGAGIAERIEAGSVLSGTVETTGGSTFGLLGQTVSVTPSTVVDESPDGISAGDGVDVHGIRTAPDRIRATYIRERPPSDEAKVKGVIEDFDPVLKSFRIGGLPVAGEMAAIGPLGTILADGIPVEAEGQLLPGGLAARRIETQNLAGEASGGELEVRGGIAAVDASARTFTILGPAGPIDGRWGPSTAFVGGAEADLAAGMEAEIEGEVIDGILRAERIDLGTEG